MCPGAASPRRVAIIRALRARGVSVDTGKGFDAQRNARLLQAKIVLNIHWSEQGLLETARLQMALSLRRFVLSEATTDVHAAADFDGSVVFCSYTALVDTVVAWLALPPERRYAVADHGYRYIQSQDPSRVLQPLMTDVARRQSGVATCEYRVQAGPRLYRGGAVSAALRVHEVHPIAHAS